MNCKRLFALAGLLAGILVACGSSGDSFSLGDLVGSYKVNDQCQVNVAGSKVSASCSWLDDGATIGIDLNATIGESSFSGTLVYSDTHGDCVNRWTFQGSASKDSPRSVSGSFSRLAGLWKGSGTQVYTWGECIGEDHSESYSYTGEVDIFGTTAHISCDQNAGGDHFEFDVEDLGDALWVDGEHVLKL